MLADLHIHSVYSDGSYSPDEICRLAVSRGVGLISVTDHDTLAGLEAKLACAKYRGLKYLSGWEVSAYEGETKIHILGYGCEVNGAYEAFMNERTRASLLRAEDRVAKLQRLGIPVTLEQVLNERSKPDLPVHTMHVARAAGKHLNMLPGEVYEQYLAIGKAANSNLGRPTPKEAIDCIHASGGIASIAHPGRIVLPFEERERTLTELVNCGADGIEAVYTTHTEKETEYFRAFAKERGLLVTGGSDTHYEDDIHRIGAPAFSPCEELLERLKIL